MGFSVTIVCNYEAEGPSIIVFSVFEDFLYPSLVVAEIGS